ncbi:hypothetical protein C0Q44_00530 [Paenibacillus sp. PCH8]|uniref:hypothetical protein n=1 Tax=Paenibacillus sp. PCH8 TaxID=2066524 RepID=UPI000CFA3294|nr:hypothetical protein [Paenibacillus sp. PCH8]PQP83253.1 hypothetical protein C0Q44_00530 [Paenibacillus sp. PCH8]
MEKWTFPIGKKTATTKKEKFLSKTEYLISDAAVVLQWLNARVKPKRNFADLANLELPKNESY